MLKEEIKRIYLNFGKLDDEYQKIVDTYKAQKDIYSEEYKKELRKQAKTKAIELKNEYIRLALDGVGGLENKYLKKPQPKPKSEIKELKDMIYNMAILQNSDDEDVLIDLYKANSHDEEFNTLFDTILTARGKKVVIDTAKAKAISPEEREINKLKTTFETLKGFEDEIPVINGDSLDTLSFRKIDEDLA